ncbi:hypothetical protein COLO4_02103 [Corchorus olitorius]|uniref:Uncharacterized protein n=1 Tax=Corchorus olitorius TaxID=93759 RepID=A0A1R3L1G7_9ROSI|nr:hypothetical protein COLO4_02103 [Corchorus olitorius]
MGRSYRLRCDRRYEVGAAHGHDLAILQSPELTTFADRHGRDPSDSVYPINNRYAGFSVSSQVAIADGIQGRQQLFPLGVTGLQPREHPPVRRAVVAVVEHADVPAPAQLFEKVEQGAGPLGEFEAEHLLLADPRGMAAHGVADMQLGQFVVGQVQHRKALVAQALDEGVARIALGMGLDADEDMGLFASVVAVIEFGDLPPAQGLAEGAKTARPFGDGHGDDGFALLAQFGALGHVSQPIEVDIGARVDGHQHLAARTFTLGVFLDPGHA